MLRLLLIVSWAALAASFARGETPEIRDLEILRTIPHTGYSEGLDWKDGFLWHTIPEQTMKIDPADGLVVERHPPASKYNEAPTWIGDTLVVLSWHDDGIYSSKRLSGGFVFERVGKTPEVHGWGSAYDGKHLIITGDYSKKLYFLDPRTMELKRTIEAPISALEDLAWDGTGIWASSFTDYRGCIFRIDPKTGNIGSLWRLPNPEQCPVIDGLAFDGKTLWLTGKQCPMIFNVKLPVERKISSSRKGKGDRNPAPPPESAR